MSFHRKLEFVAAVVERRLKNNSPSYRGYRTWIKQADAARIHRNELVHGRWYINPRTEEAVNIIGLPTSEAQHEKRYSLQTLQNTLAEIRNLQSTLSKLRQQEPL